MGKNQDRGRHGEQRPGRRLEQRGGHDLQRQELPLVHDYSLSISLHAVLFGLHLMRAVGLENHFRVTCEIYLACVLAR